MSSKSGDRNMLDQPNESAYETKRRLKISYSREFLLSLAGLEICKKLPSGFDESILSEFEDGYQERQRIPGSFSSHGFRRNDYGSSLPTKGEPNNYSRGIHVRWESYSSGRSDKDTDSQSDRESDSTNHYKNPSRRGWQVSEHDGLLGSGLFPRTSGYAPGASAPKFQPSDNYQLNRTKEPYHPPRLYKAVSNPRRETKDSYNDETFGSSECMTEDKAEEERKRRASFELMRKEQQRAFQERQKMNPERRRDDFDITSLLEDSGQEVNVQAVTQEFISDPPKSSLSSQVPAPRPAVPPGFAGAVHERKSNMVELKVTSEGSSRNREDLTPDGPSDYQEVKQVVDKMGLTMKQHGSTEIQVALTGRSDKNVLPAQDASVQPLYEKDILGNDHLSSVMGRSSSSDILGLDSEKTAGIKPLMQSNNSTIVLEKLFGSAVALDVSGSSPVLEQKYDREEDGWSPRTVQSSKFARWFLKEEKKPSVHPVSSQSNELLSLIVGGEKSDPLVPDAQTSEQVWSNSLLLGSQLTEGHITSKNATTATVRSSELFSDGKVDAAPAVLTCEDLENSMLSEINESGIKQQLPLQEWGINDTEVNGPGAGADNRASQHLLSLLHKGTDPGGTLSNLNLNARFSENQGSIESEIVGQESDRPKEPTGGTLPSLGKTLTLETLFGTAFMKELQSVGAPVSVQRGFGSTGSAKVEAVEPQAFSFAQLDADIFSSRDGSETGALTLNQRQQVGLEKLDKHLIGFNDLQTHLDISQIKTEVRPTEEDSLSAVNDPLYLGGFMPADGPPTKAEVLASQTTLTHIIEKSATLNSNLKEKLIESQGLSPYHAPLNKEEPGPFQNLHLQRPPSQLHPQQFNPMGTNFHLLGSSHGQSDSQVKLMARDFIGNMIQPPIQHSGSGFTGFNPPTSHHHPVLQQAHMAGGFPPAHQFQEFVRAPLAPPPHPNHQLPGFNHEMNPMQGLHFGAHRQPNYGRLDLPHPAPDMGGGNGQPEALKRLIEMEGCNTSAKQMHPGDCWWWRRDAYY